MPIARRDLDLARIASRETHDPMLDRLALIGDSVIGLPVTLLVNGGFIEGQLGSPEQWAELADEAVYAALDQGSATEAGDSLADFREGFGRNDFKTYVAKRREGTKRASIEWEDTGSADFEEVIARGGELSQKMIRRNVPRPAFTLLNAVIETATGQRVEVGTMRVVTAHVAAWWIGRRA